MKIVCIGDSLTEGDYGVYGKSGIANVKLKNYPFFLKLLTNAEVENCGKCGYTASTYLKYYQSGAVSVKNADKIIILLGTNGGLNPDVNTQGNKDYEELINLIRSDEPKAAIYVCTPPHATIDTSKSNCGYMPNIEKAVLFVRNYAKNNELKCIELANCDLFNAENEAIMQPNDGLHFSEIGYGVMAAYIRKNIEL